MPPLPRSAKRPPAASTSSSTAAASVSMDLFDQPGHLLRRAHQIAMGMFDDLVGTDITPSQFAILRMVHEQPGIDQVGLARQIGLDTSTAALTAARLQTRGMLDRAVSAQDRRLLRLTLTPDGEALLASTVSGVHRMREKLLSSLPPGEREHFMELLRKFVHVNNEESRAPLRPAKPKLSAVDAGDAAAPAAEKAPGQAQAAKPRPRPARTGAREGTGAPPAKAAAKTAGTRARRPG